jgi:alkylation response protein AidB-like acyl-CoA dehydrogenase
MLGGEFAVLQAPMLDGLSLDPFTLFDDGRCPAEVGVGGRHIVQALVVALVVYPIIQEAAKFAAAFLEPLNTCADEEGVRLDGGRVRTAHGHREAWAPFVEGGWPLLDHPQAEGGMALSLATGAVVQEVLDRSCPAFAMLAVPQRSAARLIRTYGDDQIREKWLPSLVSGECGATICVSEPDAGSDAGRIGTRAEPRSDGSWEITGEKVWISFGDHDLTDQIVHCLLARTPGQPAGGRGLSLFLVPTVLEDGTRNSIVVRRIEEKMGLRGSPTCALGFEGARVLTIFEGTTGIQALDLAHRRLIKGDREGYSAFLAAAGAAAAACPVPESANFVRALDVFEQASQALITTIAVRDIDAGATAYLFDPTV